MYQYETIPQELRTQVVYIMEDTFQILQFDRTVEEVYGFINKTLCREYGVFALEELTSSNQHEVLDSSNPANLRLVINFFLETEEIEKAIDVIELFFQAVNQDLSNLLRDTKDRQNTPVDIRLPGLFYSNMDKQHADSLDIEIKRRQYEEAIDELNQRFREHGVGYQYESGQMIRVDSQLIHSEAVQPALRMLADPMYEGANAEFLSAHKHYRAKDYKECMNDCLKAFESCIKSICDARGWAHNAGDTANRLIGIVFDHELIPTFMKSHLSSLRNTLPSGVPTVRNRLSGHGQGSKKVDVPEHIAGYVLNLTASNILLLAKANEDMK